jgi:hypothetical protein
MSVTAANVNAHSRAIAVVATVAVAAVPVATARDFFYRRVSGLHAGFNVTDRCGGCRACDITKRGHDSGDGERLQHSAYLFGSGVG